MKYLFVGDVHNHTYIFNDVARLDKEYNFDKIIFMGDYVDDWLTTNHQSLVTLDRLFDLKQTNPEKYTLLIGNHELSYLGYECSGHDSELEDVMEMKLKENIDLLDFYTIVQCGDEEFVCTHAGITNEYIRNMLDGELKWKEVLSDINKDKLNNLYMLSMVSGARGGSEPFSSFVWADIREHSYNNQFEPPIIKHQIMGHTPVTTCRKLDDFIFIDTHSTYRDGREYGDKSYLMWNEDNFEILE